MLDTAGGEYRVLLTVNPVDLLKHGKARIMFTCLDMDTANCVFWILLTAVYSEYS